MDAVIFGLQEFGGISNYWARLLDFMSYGDAVGTNLILPKSINFKNFKSQWSEDFETKTEFLPNAISRYMNGACTSKPDVYHTSYYRLPNKTAKKNIVTVYDFTYERFRSGLPKLVHSFQKITAIKNADAVLCISNSTKNDVLEFIPSIDPSLVHVTPLGVDLNKFYIDDASEDDISDMVLFVGQRNGYKRFDLAVRAIEQSPELKLGIVGPNLSNSERENLHNRLDHRWEEFGPTSNEHLRHLYSNAFSFIFPSDYEGFGLPILEAMACGCPVLASKLSSLPEVGGAAALYAETQSGEAYAANLDLLLTSNKRNYLIKAGLDRAKIFTWENTVRLTVDHYK